MTAPVPLSGIYLRPGELCISHRPARITTVLGSCVAVTLYHRPTGLAAICHAVQPVCRKARTECDHCQDRYRYADCVIGIMVREMTGLGVRRLEIETKLFGGAAIISSGSASPHLTVGCQNVRAAMAALATNGLALKVADVGGRTGRKIIFNTATGEVLLKRLGQAGCQFKQRAPEHTGSCRQKTITIDSGSASPDDQLQTQVMTYAVATKR